MDSNKDEADRCLELAEKYIREDRYDDAERFVKKAMKLYPTKKVEDLLAKLSSSSTTKQNQKKETEPELRKRQATSSTTTSSSKSTTSQSNNTSSFSDYTKEQYEHVKRVKKCKDYYEILSVTKEATDNDIKKAYKKLALQLHPDKNKAPGAGEAFKAIGNAVAVLTDVQKRKQYDLYGSDEERMQSSRGNAASNHHSYTRGFEADITAEELFNMFFGGGFPQQEFYMRRTANRWTRQSESQTQHQHAHHHQQQHQQQQANSYTAILQMLPVLLLILLTMMSSFFISDPIYSLHSNAKYSVQRTTQDMKVPYYVKENFHSEYQGSLRRLEISVEEEYMNNLRHACYREKSYKDSMVWKARNFGDAELFQKAKNIDTPSCRRLQDVQAA
ncbi:hypothetical protein HCN44_002905 [Aphidius gifuensis]|uniref:J domain-containing protein n=1 Tax=Aphidius gifuensis TaxID=684658 RepID=A0A834XRQ6_APHGI|nr:dnaJ homolog subfamily B member 12 [Aphidius gifuensis]KAF7991343.1 hypothetical protein HCN44_002905 [Aphidius gifuensis]